MIPPSQPRCRTAKESRGVDLGSGKRWTVKPAAARTRAQHSANSFELRRASRAMTTDRVESAPLREVM